jgi:hypothetical protein
MIFFLQGFVAYYYCHLLKFSKITSLRISKQLKSRFFSIVLIVNGRIRILEAQKLTNPEDPDRPPDPDHCLEPHRARTK